MALATFFHTLCSFSGSFLDGAFAWCVVWASILDAPWCPLIHLVCTGYFRVCTSVVVSVLTRFAPTFFHLQLLLFARFPACKTFDGATCLQQSSSAAPTGGCPPQTALFKGVGAFVNLFFMQSLAGLFIPSFIDTGIRSLARSLPHSRSVTDCRLRMS